jgi:PKD repeat protein
MILKNRICYAAVFLSIFLLAGCDKDDEKFTPLPENVSKPEISFTYSGAGIFAPAAVSFANATSNAFSYKWYFGDNYTSTEGNPVHIYTEGGTYTVKLVATGQAGTDSSTQTLTILNAPTTLKITAVTITDMSFVNNLNVNWDTGNGPDLYFKITDSDTTVLYDGFSMLDSNVVQSDLPLTWTLTVPFISNDFSEFKSVKIYDDDDFPDADDFIGGAGFTPATHATAQDHYPTSIVIDDDDLFITLTLKWQ